MKNLFFYLFIVALIFTSCKEGHDRADKEETADTEQAKTAKETDSDSSCFSSENVYPSTAWIWSQSWATYANYENEKENPSFITLTSPELIFKSGMLNKLKSKNKNANGVLLYYLLRDDDSDPSLAMVTLVDCQKVEKGDVLVKWYKGEEEFIPYDSLHQYKTNWDNANKKRMESIKGYVPVKAYNYSWKTLDELYNSNDPKSGIRVKYGVRTLGPGEIVNFTPKNKPIEMVTGNIVVCNILTSWEEDSDIAFNEVIKNLSDTSQELDFALPCPEFCGKE